MESSAVQLNPAREHLEYNILFVCTQIIPVSVSRARSKWMTFDTVVGPLIGFLYGDRMNHFAAAVVITATNECPILRLVIQ